MNKPIKPKKTVTENIIIHDGSCYGESLKNFIDSVPEGITLDKVKFETDIESGYYNDHTAILRIYYINEIANPNYERELKEYNIQLNKYNLILEKEKYLKNNKDKYFKVGETIYLLWHKTFFGKHELAPYKKATEVKITKVLPPKSVNKKPMDSENWCQIIYFNDDGGHEISSVLYSKDVICRKKEYLFI